MDEVEERLTEVMTASLESVVDVEHQVLPPARVVREWRLPEGDLSALAKWGLPPVALGVLDFQVESEPVLVPNVAGPVESRLITPEDRLYRVGRLGSDDSSAFVGAVDNDGRIMAIHDKPLTAQDMHPDLREHYRDLYRPSVYLINSSMAHLVEISWRWLATLDIFSSLEFAARASLEDADEYLGSVDEYYARMASYQRLVLEHIERIDDQVRADDPESYWGQTVTDPGC
ncbi:SUKH-4 family immunity protein [Actinokineospora globicatena]|uniref:SUKH-4 family immunity protein n=1 Tax=Actinokineospora globicatena TaxID=103729 RepID=UPI0020A39D2B|nr:SUKH-4 family immunity protein [Actinokineospora globicatena]MCP2306164.1 hypothetical protein [Actinokineospora globicatena]GLW79962.1 hypothetical protein Aglo01_44430 [Actinokineospora globicatena]GLW86791.1 hypothetical protein Aglo02_44300 [Actinokineospora globicatena]